MLYVFHCFVRRDGIIINFVIAVYERCMNGVLRLRREAATLKVGAGSESHLLYLLLI